jgi:WXG100 family type VII secretion target
MADFEFDTEAMEEAKNQYKEAIDEINGIKERLKEKLEELKSSSWQSKGGEAFFKKFKFDWADETDKYIMVVEHMCELLDIAKDSFEELLDEANSLKYNG